MSFREKSAWISFISILFFFAVYFGRVVKQVGGGSGDRTLFSTFLVAVAGLVLLEVGLHVAVALRSPREARTPKDERERLIDMRATQVAFPVLLVGTLLSIWTIHTDAGRWWMAQSMLLSIVIAELVKFGTQIALHRRGF